MTALAEPPTPLWIRGAWTPGRRAVALVGARAATARGLEAARELGARLASAGVDVVSGGALGIDAASHRGALDVARSDGAARTVAVLGTGIDVAYPERNAAMFDEIVASGGALVTQFEPGAQPRKSSFPSRNVIIAALADVVVVVEAGLASGTTHTVRAMRALGRAVAALPGSQGTDALIVSGAAVAVADADDVLAILDGKRPAPPALPEDPLAAKIYAVLDDVPRDVGELAFRAGLAVGTCAAMVVDLELGGLAARAAGGRYLRLR
ncbi:MAG TPA: DNA-processing protein DprA [Polyangia bacterium]|nr:DNA-processing protein DprA [Polyangia bacterium]